MTVFSQSHIQSSLLGVDKFQDVWLHQFPFLQRPHELISVEQSNHFQSLLSQSTYSSHPICLPLSAIACSFSPFIYTQTLSFVILELTPVNLPPPAVHSCSMFHALPKITLILFSIGQLQATAACLQLIQPLSFINIPIFIAVISSVATVTHKSTYKFVSVEKGKLAFNFLIPQPLTHIYCPLAKIVNSLSLLLPRFKSTCVLVLIAILKAPLAMRQALLYLSSVATSFSEQHPPLPTHLVPPETSHVAVPRPAIKVASTSFPHSVLPLSLIYLLQAAVQSLPILYILSPQPLVVAAVRVEVGALPLHLTSAHHPVIHLSIPKHVHSLPLKLIPTPVPKIYFSISISVQAFSLPHHASSLAHVPPTIWVRQLLDCRHSPKATQKFCLAEIVGASDLLRGWTVALRYSPGHRYTAVNISSDSLQSSELSLLRRVYLSDFRPVAEEDVQQFLILLPLVKEN